MRRVDSQELWVQGGYEYDICRTVKVPNWYKVNGGSKFSQKKIARQLLARNIRGVSDLACPRDEFFISHDGQGGRNVTFAVVPRL